MVKPPCFDGLYMVHNSISQPCSSLEAPGSALRNANRSRLPPVSRYAPGAGWTPMTLRHNLLVASRVWSLQEKIQGFEKIQPQKI